MNLEQFVRTFQLRGQHLMWLIGAGASVSSGIPSAFDIIDDLKRRILFSTLNTSNSLGMDIGWSSPVDSIDAALASLGIEPPSSALNDYAWYFEQAFPQEADRRLYIANSMSEASPQAGYRGLAKIMNDNLCQIVWTTNFDRMIEDAFAHETGTTSRLTVASLSEPEIARTAINEQRWPLLCKLHGDFQSRLIKNVKPDLQRQDKDFRRLLLQTSEFYGLIVIGYSGRDQSLMDVLHSAIDTGTRFPHGLYWFVRPNSSINNSVLSLVERAKGYNINANLVECDSFDQLMDRLGQYVSNSYIRVSSQTKTESGGNTKPVTMPPRPVRSFYGRSGEIHAIRDSLETSTDQPSVYALHGLSGVGKSQLVRKYVESYREQYKVTYWVQRSEELSPIPGLASYARQLSLQGATEDDPLQSASAFLQHLEATSSWLLVFDDFRPEEISSVLPTKGQGHVVITSQSPNWLAITRHVHRLRGFSLSEAVDFLLSRTNQKDTESARSIFDSFGGLPLAMEQAATYIEKSALPLASYVALLASHRSELLSNSSAFAEYPNSVQTALGLAVENVKATHPAAVSYLAYLSVFPSTPIARTLFDSIFEKISIVTGAPFSITDHLNTLQALSSLSLIEINIADISCHPLVSAYVRDGWEADSVHDCALFVLEVMTYIFPEGEGSEHWPRVEEMIDLILGTSGYLDQKRVDSEFVEAMLNNASIFLHNRGRIAESVRMINVAVAIAVNTFGPSDIRSVRARANLASYLHSLKEYETSEIEHLEAIAFLSSREPGDLDEVDLLGRVHSNLGSLYLDLGRHEEAEVQFKAAIDIHGKAFGSEYHSTAIDIQNLGRLYRDQQQWLEAYQCFTQAIDVLRTTLGDRDYRFGSAVYARASAAFNLANYNQCLRDLAEALAIFEVVFAGTSHELLVETLCSTATVLHQTGQFRASLPIYDRAISLCEHSSGVSQRMVNTMREERGEAATKAILTLISHTNSPWRFKVPIIRAKLLDFSDGTFALPLSAKNQHSSFYRVVNEHR